MFCYLNVNEMTFTLPLIRKDEEYLIMFSNRVCAGENGLLSCKYACKHSKYRGYQKVLAKIAVGTVGTIKFLANIAVGTLGTIKI